MNGILLLTVILLVVIPMNVILKIIIMMIANAKIINLLIVIMTNIIPVNFILININLTNVILLHANLSQRWKTGFRVHIHKMLSNVFFQRVLKIVKLTEASFLDIQKIFKIILQNNQFAKNNS